jgi:hypothetical protein
LAPLTGIAFAINWLIDKLNLKIGVVKTTRMTTYFFWFFLSERKPSIMVCTPPHLYFPSNQRKRKEGCELDETRIAT